jgi:hypothetical protein
VVVPAVAEGGELPLAGPWTATVSDNVAVDTTFLSVQLDGADATSRASWNGLTLRIAGPFPAGTHTVVVKVRDHAGHETTLTRGFVASETAPPVVPTTGEVVPPVNPSTPGDGTTTPTTAPTAATPVATPPAPAAPAPRTPGPGLAAALVTLAVAAFLARRKP